MTECASKHNLFSTKSEANKATKKQLKHSDAIMQHIHTTQVHVYITPHSEPISIFQYSNITSDGKFTVHFVSLISMPFMCEDKCVIKLVSQGRDNKVQKSICKEFSSKMGSLLHYSPLQFDKANLIVWTTGNGQPPTNNKITSMQLN